MQSQGIPKSDQNLGFDWPVGWFGRKLIQLLLRIAYCEFSCRYVSFFLHSSV